MPSAGMPTILNALVAFAGLHCYSRTSCESLGQTSRAIANILHGCQKYDIHIVTSKESQS